MLRVEVMFNQLELFFDVYFYKMFDMQTNRIWARKDAR